MISVAAVVDTVDALLPAAQNLIDRETAALEADPDVRVSCGPNCNACCEHGVVVTAAEHRAIAAAVAELSPAKQEVIVARARHIVDRGRSELPSGPEPIGADFMRAYYAMQEPCPLLVDGQCSVREVRPLVCREYLMSSPSEHCADRTLERAVRIRRRQKVGSRFREISERFHEPGPTLLPLALLTDPVPAQNKPMSGPKLARLLATS